jgi:hypothetical protein
VHTEFLLVRLVPEGKKEDFEVYQMAGPYTGLERGRHSYGKVYGLRRIDCRRQYSCYSLQRVSRLRDIHQTLWLFGFK